MPGIGSDTFCPEIIPVKANSGQTYNARHYPQQSERSTQLLFS